MFYNLFYPDCEVNSSFLINSNLTILQNFYHFTALLNDSLGRSLGTAIKSNAFIKHSRLVAKEFKKNVGHKHSFSRKNIQRKVLGAWFGRQVLSLKKSRNRFSLFLSALLQILSSTFIVSKLLDSRKKSLSCRSYLIVLITTLIVKGECTSTIVSS